LSLRQRSLNLGLAWNLFRWRVLALNALEIILQGADGLGRLIEFL